MTIFLGHFEIVVLGLELGYRDSRVGVGVGIYMCVHVNF